MSSSKSHDLDLGISAEMERELLELLQSLTRNHRIDRSDLEPQLSQTELAILRSNSPISVTGYEEVTVFGQRGIYISYFLEDSLMD